MKAKGYALSVVSLKSTKVSAIIAPIDCYAIDPYVAFSAFKAYSKANKKLFITNDSELKTIKCNLEMNQATYAIKKIQKGSVIVIDRMWGIYVYSKELFMKCFRAVNLNDKKWVSADYIPQKDTKFLLNDIKTLNGSCVTSIVDTFPCHRCYNADDCPNRIVAFCRPSSNLNLAVLINGVIFADIVNQRTGFGHDNIAMFTKLSETKSFVTTEWLNSIDAFSAAVRPSLKKYTVTCELCDVEQLFTVNRHHGNIEDERPVAELFEEQLKLPKCFKNISVSSVSDGDEYYDGEGWVFEPDYKARPWSGNPDQLSPDEDSVTGYISFDGTVTISVDYEDEIMAKSPKEAAIIATKYIKDELLDGDYDPMSEILIVATAANGRDAEFDFLWLLRECC